MSLAPSSAAALQRWVESTQATMRQPSLSAGIGRRGELVWAGGAGHVDGHPGSAAPSADTAYRIASVTKTFVAVAVLQLVEQGRISLSDKVARHVPDAPVGDATVAQLLSHSSGMQAETEDEWWERSDGYTWEQLVAQGMTRRFGAGRRHHYTNVGYAVLGRLLETLHRAPWDEVVRRQLCEPLGLTRTSRLAPRDAATGLGVHPHAALVHAEPVPDYRAMGPAGELWSSARDLVVWGSFLVGAADGPLGADLVEQLREPWALVDNPGLPWTQAHGLGVQLWNVEGRRFAGHTGSVPGFTCEVRGDVEHGDVVVVLGSATSGFGGGAGLLATYQEHEPPAAQPWVADPTQAGVLELLGSWYWGTTHYVLSAAPDLGVELAAATPTTWRASRFVPDGTDRWTGLSGYYAGEPLRVLRDAAGRVSHLDLASFRLSRLPYQPDADLPGGTDERGWH